MDEQPKKYSILLVEDEAAAAFAASEALKKEGYDVITASTAEAGLALALNRHPDLVLTDLRLPKMSGLEMIDRIREDQPWGQNVEVIVLTNLVDERLLSGSVTGEQYFYLLKGDETMANVIAAVNAKLKVNVLTPAPKTAGASEAYAEGRQTAEDSITYSD